MLVWHFFLFSIPCFLLVFCPFLLFLYSLFFPFFSFSFCIFSFLPFSFLSFVFDYFPCFFFTIDLRLSCACVVIDTTCSTYVVVFLGWQAVYLVFPGASNDTYAPAWTWHIVDRLPISLLYVSGGGMNCVSCDICVYQLELFLFSLGYSSAPEWLEPVLWPRTWLFELMWEQQQHRSRPASR